MGKIDIQNVSLDYTDTKNTFRALQNISLDIKEGEFLSLLGPSGCGKSSLLRILTGLVPPTEGEVLIDGKNVTGPGRDRGVVFQNYSLFPWMTAKKNVAFGIKQVNKELSGKERNALADEYLEKVELYEYRDKFVRQLSGGQQQRVSIARALAMDTAIMLMDEPFGALDPGTRATLQGQLLDLWRNDKSGRRKTIVFVTHDVDEAIYLSDRIVVMKPHPGEIRKIVQVPFSRPRNRKALMMNQEYQNFRQKLVTLFNETEYTVSADELYKNDTETTLKRRRAV